MLKQWIDKGISLSRISLSSHLFLKVFSLHFLNDDNIDYLDRKLKAFAEMFLSDIVDQRIS